MLPATVLRLGRLPVFKLSPAGCQLLPASRRLLHQKVHLVNVFKDLDKDPDRLSEAAKSVIKTFGEGDDATKKELLVRMAENCGVKHDALGNAISLYNKNPLMSHEVLAAASPVHYHLLRSVGNQSEGVKMVCEMRKDLLSMMKTTDDKHLVSQLRRLEESARDLLTTWFCLSNLKLNRLTWQSPGDILQKIAEYEAVHPMRGLLDFQKRLGTHRRCYYFSHEAMPREPLVMVHVALMDDIGDSVQDIMSGKVDKSPESQHSTAIYYSITSTQKGLAGIDLGNLLIKRVAAQISADVPSVSVHSTLSPIPGFRAWLIRSLKGHSEYGSVVGPRALELVANLTGKQQSAEEATQLILKTVSNTRISLEQLEPLREVLLHFCAKYLHEAKRNGFALNPVANFHLRNGAELYRLNWMGDVSPRGLNNSLGLMVNYRYYLDRVSQNSATYTRQKVIAIDQQVLSLL